MELLIALITIYFTFVCVVICIVMLVNGCFTYDGYKKTSNKILSIFLLICIIITIVCYAIFLSIYYN